MLTITIVLKATAILVMAWALATLLKHRSPAVRHLVWSAALVAVLAVPLLSISLPWRVEVVTPLAAPVVDALDVAPAPASAPVETAEPATIVEIVERSSFTFPSIRPLAFWTWVAGMALLLGRLGLGLVSVAVTLRRGTRLTTPGWTRPLMESADRLEVEDLPLLVASARAAMPFTGGAVRPFIVVPQTADAWDDRRRRAVLSHELAHIRRKDVVVNTMAQVVCAIWWFHPLAWMAARQLRKESERACDNLVLGTGTRPSEYADHLLQIVCGAAHGRSPALALPMAERREFEGRMLAILEAAAQRRAASRTDATLLAAGALLVVLPVAALVPVARPEVNMPVAEGLLATVPAPAPPPAPTQPRPQQQALPQDTSRLVAALVRALSDSVADIRENAAYALGSRRIATAADALGRTLTADANAEVRTMAAWALAQIRALNGVAALARAVTTDASAETREMAAWAIGELGQPAAELGGQALIAALGDRDAEVRTIAAWALGSMRIRLQTDALINALQDPSSDVGEAAAWALGQTRDARAIPALANAMNASHEDVQEAAMWALGQMRGQEAQDALVAATASPNPQVRRAAVAALAGSSSNPWPWPRPRPIHR